MTERDLQRQVTDLAELYGWAWAHFRPAQTSKGWRTPVSGPLGAGFPDLVLLRVRDRRLLFVELKTEKGKVSADQAAVLAALGELAGKWWGVPGTTPVGLRIDVATWRPADLADPIETSVAYGVLL